MKSKLIILASCVAGIALDAYSDVSYPAVYWMIGMAGGLASQVKLEVMLGTIRK